MVRQGECVYLSNPGSDQWIEYKKSGFDFSSDELEDNENDDLYSDGPIEILK